MPSHHNKWIRAKKLHSYLCILGRLLQLAEVKIWLEITTFKSYTITIRHYLNSYSTTKEEVYQESLQSEKKYNKHKYHMNFFLSQDNILNSTHKSQIYPSPRIFATSTRY